VERFVDVDHVHGVDGLFPEGLAGLVTSTFRAVTFPGKVCSSPLTAGFNC